MHVDVMLSEVDDFVVLILRWVEHEQTGVGTFKLGNTVDCDCYFLTLIVIIYGCRHAALGIYVKHYGAVAVCIVLRDEKYRLDSFPPEIGLPLVGTVEFFRRKIEGTCRVAENAV